MPYKQTGSYITKGEQKRIDSEKKRAEQDRMQKEEEEARAEAERQEQERMRNKDPPIVLNGKAGKQNGHNCPFKDAAKTHRVTKRCFDQRHAGVCRVHLEIVSVLDGCNSCNAKGDDLQYTNIRLA